MQVIIHAVDWKNAWIPTKHKPNTSNLATIKKIIPRIVVDNITYLDIHCPIRTTQFVTGCPLNTNCGRHPALRCPKTYDHPQTETPITRTNTLSKPYHFNRIHTHTSIHIKNVHKLNHSKTVKSTNKTKQNHLLTRPQIQIQHQNQNLPSTQ